MRVVFLSAFQIFVVFLELIQFEVFCFEGIQHVSLDETGIIPWIPA